MTTDSDEVLWAAFHRAKDALLISLESPMPYTKHLLLTPTAERDIARTSLQHEIDRGELGLREILSVQERLSDAAQRIVKRTEEAQTLMSPCACMPVEILREVFLFVLKPEDPATTIRASSISSSWRSIIVKESSLFSHADWNAWPAWLIGEWCSRARDRPLHLELGESLLRKNLLGQISPYRSLLEATKPSWGTLGIHIPLGSSPTRVSEWLLRDALPSLHSLQYYYYRNTDWETCVVGITMPNIRTMDIEGLALRPTSPLTKLVELSITPLYDSTQENTYNSTWVEMIRMSPALVNLTIRAAVGFPIAPHPSVVIPTLRTLVIVDNDCADAQYFTTLFRFWSLPNLRQLRTVNLENVYSAADAAEFLDALVCILYLILRLIMHPAHILEIPVDSLCAASRVSLY